MAKGFIALYLFFRERKFLFYFFFFTTIVILTILSSRIKLIEDITQMLPDEKSANELSYIFKNSKLTDKILVCISGKDSTKSISANILMEKADELDSEINKKLGNYVESIQYKSNDSLMLDLLSLVEDNLPLFLDSGDYNTLAAVTTHDGVNQKLENNYKLLTGPAGIVLKKFIMRDPLGIDGLALRKFQNLVPDEQIDLYNGYFFTQDHKNILLMISPEYPSSKTAKNIVFFNKLNQLTDSLASNDFTIDYFGAPAVAAANSRQIRKDTYLTISITVIILILIITGFFRNFFYSLLMMVPVLIGILFALAVIAITKQSISVIAIGGGSIILGIAVNYSLHFLIHTKYHSIEGTIKEITHPLILGNFTTIGGFLCLLFLDVQVLKDLGVFAALSLAGAALASLIFLPQLVTSKNVNTISQHDDNRKSPLDFSNRSSAFHLLFFVGFIGLTVFSIYYFNDIAFENDLFKINYMSPRLIKAEKKINSITSFNAKSVFYMSSDSTMDHALAKAELMDPKVDQLLKSGKIITYSGVKNVLMSIGLQQKKINDWNKFWTEDKEQNVLLDLLTTGKKFHFKEFAFNPFRESLQKKYKPFSSEETNQLVNSYFKNYVSNNRDAVTVTSLIKVDPKHVSEVYNTLSSVSGIYIFDRQYITQSLVKTVGNNFNFIAVSSSLLVFIALLITYGRIEFTLITFIPMVISWIWIIGIMAAFHIKFNIINVILSTFVFALGDDFSIFTTDGLIQKYVSIKKDLRPVRLSILLATLTTVVGLGVLIIAKHPALRSIALVSIIGILSVWVVSQTLQPILFNSLITNRARRGWNPITLFGFFKSAFAFSYFIFGSYLLTLIGIILFLISPIFKTRKVFNWLTSKFAKSLIYVMVNIRKNILNPGLENFSKPGIIIANHQSFIDILLMIMLHPKLILVTNKWVWNSPVFGAVVRIAGYLPVIEDLDNQINKLQLRLKEGYSIVIFPEGTRSANGKIGRFHKGAFYLAEKLNLDIIPVLIHGTGYCIPKGDFFVNDGHMTVKILPRIFPNDMKYGTGYYQRTKSISIYFKNEFEKLKEYVETVDYYKDPIIRNYLFKGPVLEWYLKVKLKLEKNYRLFDELLPRKGKILDIGCGYGFMCNMLGLTSPERSIKGIDFDNEKIEIAENGYIKGANVTFECKNANDPIKENYDAIILTDVLHYLKHAEQIDLLNRCLEKLTDNGMIIIRDGFDDYKTRHKGTLITEWFSTKLFKFNKMSDQGLSFPSLKLVEDIARLGKLNVRKIDNTHQTSNIIFVLNKLPFNG